VKSATILQVMTLGFDIILTDLVILFTYLNIADMP